MLCVRLFVGWYMHMVILQLEDYSEDSWAETVTNSHKSPSLSLNPTSVKVMQHSSLPLPLISRFHTRHVYSRPSLIEVIQPSRCQTRGVLSLSLSSGCVTQEALSFHYPAFPPQHLSQTEVYGNTAAESSPGLHFMNQWNMLQTLHAATPLHLPITHRWAHTGRKRRGLRRSLWIMGMYWLVRKLVRRMLYHHSFHKFPIIIPHDLEAQMQKEPMCGWLFVSSCWQILFKLYYVKYHWV